MVGIALLKTHLSRYLDRVREGAEVVVYDRETPIARIVPYTPRGGRPTGGSDADGERLAELERRGVIARRGDPRATARWARALGPVTLPKGTPTLTRTIQKLRDEERW
jgi:prevent-host-death family protein